MKKPRLLDLFCKAGGATRGYQLAGYEVVGVDIEPQPNYIGDHFVQDDALKYVAKYGRCFAAIHASPPCQHYSRLNTKYRDIHPDLIAPVRKLLIATGRPYVIENVEDARLLLNNPLMLCGSMFGLPIERHRYFEHSFPIPVAFGDPLYCRHIANPVLVSGVSRRSGQHRRENSAAECRQAMQTDWMTRAEMDEAIPPAYTRFIGPHMMRAIWER